MYYINAATLELIPEKALREIFKNDYDGDTNPLLFAEWCNGYHYEIDNNGNPYKCIYRRIA